MPQLLCAIVALRQPQPRALDRALYRSLLDASFGGVHAVVGGTAGTLFTFKSNFAQLESPARSVCSQTAFRARRPCAGFHHPDAVDGAWRQAQLASSAVTCDYRVHQSRRTDNRIDRARLDAQRAADTKRFVYHCNGRRFGRAEARVNWFESDAEQRGELARAVLSAGGALVGFGASRGECLGVGPAAAIAALAALRLRQQSVNACDQLRIRYRGIHGKSGEA